MPGAISAHVDQTHSTEAYQSFSKYVVCHNPEVPLRLLLLRLFLLLSLLSLALVLFLLSSASARLLMLAGATCASLQT